jgi:hypothetical protein
MSWHGLIYAPMGHKRTNVKIARLKMQNITQ